jgi:hypothetical protein
MAAMAQPGTRVARHARETVKEISVHNEPFRDPAKGKPSNPPRQGRGSGEEALKAEGEEQEMHDKAGVKPQPISREAAERGIPADPDPDDPVSP